MKEAYSLTAVVAMAANRVIGKDGNLPWHIPDDLRCFRRITIDHPVIMGRRTFESLGKPLGRRRNIVISRSLTSQGQDIEVIQELSQLDTLDLEGEVFLIGGGRLYADLLPKCSKIYLSYIYEKFEGDTFFPEFESAFGQPEILETHPEFELRLYQRKDA